MISQASFGSGRDAPASALAANSRPGVLGSLHPDRGSRICALDEPSGTLLCATVRSRDHFGMTSVPFEPSHKSASYVITIAWLNQSCVQRRGRGRPRRRGDPAGKAAGFRADLAAKCSVSLLATALTSQEPEVQHILFHFDWGPPGSVYSQTIHFVDSGSPLVEGV